MADDSAAASAAASCSRKKEASFSIVSIFGLRVSCLAIFSSVRIGTPLPADTAGQRYLVACSFSRTKAYMDSLMDADYKPALGFKQPTSGEIQAIAFVQMRKRPGRPRLDRDPKRGIYRVLSDNIDALLDYRMRLNEQSMTDAAKDAAASASMSPNTIIRAYGGRNDTGIETLEKIAKIFRVRAADLLIDGQCRRIMDARMSRPSSEEDSSESSLDDARSLHGPPSE